ncbi:hypothetical protein PHLCEN_2v10551 [Hermanssonia centrifuga]|uniref:Uncharacterized protein n=1 Tax=Hermanssonia centrifuga TaxID=98765 RepID=A0A2R6NMX4_9APHY|nr:hypothetical protein PHLCEN_2v10551 [Hermanssonia centrifuga]
MTATAARKRENQEGRKTQSQFSFSTGVVIMLTTALIAALRLLDGIKIALHSESSVFASSNGDLEASVEILSGGKDEALTQLRKIMKDLMQENQVLRQLLRSLSSFIGDGAGGLLPKLGWDLNDFNNFVNRSETDTAWESYQRHKRDEQNSGTPAPSTSQKRSSEDDHNGGRAKRSRAPGEQNGDGERDQYSLLVPVNPAVPPLPANGLYAPSSSRSQEAIFNDLMRGSSGSPMFVPPTPPSNGQFSSQSTSSVAPNHSPYQTSYAPPINVNVDSALPSMSLINNSGAIPTSRSQASSSQQPKPTQSTTSPADDDQDPKRHEAYKLIHFLTHFLDIIWITTNGTVPIVYRHPYDPLSSSGE